MAYALGNRHASKPTDPATPINHYDYLWSNEAAASRDQDKIRQTCSAATIRSFPPDSDCGCRMRPAGAKPSTTMRARNRSTRPASTSRRAGEAMTGAAENTPRGGAGAGAEGAARTWSNTGRNRVPQAGDREPTHRFGQQVVIREPEDRALLAPGVLWVHASGLVEIGEKCHLPISKNSMARAGTRASERGQDMLAPREERNAVCSA